MNCLIVCRICEANWQYANANYIDEVCDLCVGEGCDVVLFGWCPSISDVRQPKFRGQYSPCLLEPKTTNPQSQMLGELHVLAN